MAVERLDSHWVWTWLIPRLTAWLRLRGGDLIHFFRDGSALMSFVQQDQTIIKYQHPPENLEASKELRTEQLGHRRQEVSATIDLLFEEDTPANIWQIVGDKNDGVNDDKREDLVKDPIKIIKGRIRRDHVGMAGHSFGATTALLAAQQDHRISCVLGLDPWMFPLPSSFTLDNQKRGIPTFIINSETFHWPQNLETLRAVLIRNRELNETVPSLQVTIPKTGHLDQSDLATILPAWVVAQRRGGATADPTKSLAINCKLVQVFMNGLFGLYNQTKVDNYYNQLVWNLDHQHDNQQGSSLPIKEEEQESNLKIDIKL